MKILVTGNRGRIGSVIEAQLLAQGHTVIGFDLADGDDIRDGEAVHQAAKGCDGVIHLAALLGTQGRQDPDRAMAITLMGTWHVLMAAKAYQLKRVVYFSSVNALGIFMGEKEPDYLPIDDDYPPQPGRPYGLSKRLAEEMCRYFTAETGIATICLRPPAVWYEDTYEKIRDRRRENPEFEWQPYWEYGAFCDVRDVATAAILGLTCPDPGHVTVLLCADDISASLPSREIAAKVMPNVPWRGNVSYDTNPWQALVSNQRAKAVLGWQPQYKWRPVD